MWEAISTWAWIVLWILLVTLILAFFAGATVPRPGIPTDPKERELERLKRQQEPPQTWWEDQ